VLELEVVFVEPGCLEPKVTQVERNTVGQGHVHVAREGFTRERIWFKRASVKVDGAWFNRGIVTGERVWFDRRGFTRTRVLFARDELGRVLGFFVRGRFGVEVAVFKREIRCRRLLLVCFGLEIVFPTPLWVVLGEWSVH
jgi:hypothetical protein